MQNTLEKDINASGLPEALIKNAVIIDDNFLKTLSSEQIVEALKGWKRTYDKKLFQKILSAYRSKSNRLSFMQIAQDYEIIGATDGFKNTYFDFFWSIFDYRCLDVIEQWRGLYRILPPTLRGLRLEKSILRVIDEHTCHC